jgi:DNA invertase Pin-like site-specific DNA recombinase
LNDIACGSVRVLFQRSDVSTQATDDWTTLMGDVVGPAEVLTTSQGLTRQQLPLEAAHALCAYEDVRCGRTMDRIELRKLLAFGWADDTLAIVRLNCVGRSLLRVQGTVELLNGKRTALLSPEERIEMSAAAGGPVFHASRAVAHFERRLLTGRAMDGIAVGRARRKRFGRCSLDCETATAALKQIQAGPRPVVAVRQMGQSRATISRELAQAGVGRPT